VNTLKIRPKRWPFFSTAFTLQRSRKSLMGMSCPSVASFSRKDRAAIHQWSHELFYITLIGCGILRDDVITKSTHIGLHGEFPLLLDYLN
jgi:hypothetical protein